MRLSPSNWQQHDYETNVEADAIVKAIERMTEEIHASVVGNVKMDP